MISISSIKGHKMFKDMSWTLVAQVTSNLLRFLLIFIVIRCYSREEYGLWASITSIAAVIVTGDFGLTNVLRNIVSKNISKGEKGSQIIKNSFISVVIFLGLFAVFVLTLILTMSDYILFEGLFKTDDENLRQMGRTIIVVVIGIFLINLPLGATSGLFISYGEIKEGSIFNIANSILTFVVVVLLSLLHLRIDIVCIVYFVCSLMVNLCSTIYFLNRRGWRSFHISFIDAYRNIKEMLPTGLGFLGVGFSSNFIPNVLTIYSGALLGLSTAASINVAQKIYTLFMSIMISVLNPLWAKLSQLYFEGDFARCRKIMKISFGSTVIISIVVIVGVVLFRKFLVYFIAGDGYEAEIIVFLLVGGCLLSKAIFDNAALLLFATNRLRFILVGYLVFCGIVFFVFPQIFELCGFNWMMMSLILCWCFFIISVLIYTQNYIRKSEYDIYV